VNTLPRRQRCHTIVHSNHVTCFLFVVLAERIWDGELTSLEFRSSKGTAVWPEEQLEDLVCDITCAVVHLYWECVIE
jgi:hypothetical protein